jgi:SAM-dependent methyltransferase
MSSIGLPKGDHIVRYSMYKALEAEPRAQITTGPVLSISHSTDLCRRLSAPGVDIIEANYPDQAINALNFPDDTFTAVISDQVLEHIECDPCAAAAEVHRVLKHGGLAIHTTCFVTPYHGSDQFDNLEHGDFWRFTPSGLARLHKKYSEIVVADGWGHPLMPILGGLGVLRMPVPDVAWHPLNWLARMNRKSYAFVVWVVARK